jgi:hypothetical protein
VITGDAYVEISVGNRKDPLIPGGSMIDCVKDTEIIEQAKAMLDETKNTMAEIKAAIIPTLQNVQQELPPLMIQVRKTLQQGEVLMRDDLPGLTTQTQDTLMELQILIRGIQRHWLFRKYIENPENGPLISPASLPLDPAKQTGGESK